MSDSTSLDPYILTGVIGILSATVGALIWIIKFLFQKLLPMIEKALDNIENNTEATKAADKYLRERNGRDSEIHTKLIKAVDEIPVTMRAIADNSVEAVVHAVQNVPSQHVEHQHIDVSKVNEDK